MRRLAKWALRLLIAMTLVTGVAGVALSTHAGQKALLALISRAGSDADQRIVLGPFEGSVFSKGRLSRIALHDSAGEWLVVRDIAFSWEPLKLLRGSLHIREIDIARIDIMRRPAARASAATGAGGFSVLPFSIDGLNISEIALDAGLLGEPARYRLAANANFADAAQGIDGKLQLDRVDAPGSRLAAAVTYRPDDNHLSLRADGSEPAGGLLARLAGLPDSIPVTLAFDGSGPLDAWRGTVSLSASEKPFVAGSMTIDRTRDGHAFGARFDGYYDAIVPQAWRDLARGKTQAETSGTLTGEGVVQVDSLSLRNDAVRLSAAGRYAPDGADIAGQARLEISRSDGHDIALPLGAGVHARARSLHASVDVPPSGNAEPAKLRLEAASVATRAGTVQKIELAGDLKRRKGHLLDGSFDLRSVFGGMAPVDGALMDVIGEAAEVTAKGRLGGLDRVDFETLTFGVGSGTIEGKGRIEHGQFTGALRAIMQDVKPLARLAGRDVGGSVRLDVSGKAALDASELHLDVDLESPSLSIAGADGQVQGLGPAKASFKLDRTDGVRVSIENAVIVAGAVKAHGRAAIDPSQLDVEARADVSDLAVFSRRMRGAAVVEAKLSGPRTDLKSSLRVESQSAAIDSREVAGFLADLNGSGPIERHGMRVALNARITGRQLTGRSGLAISDGALLIESLDLDWAGLAVRGGARVSMSDVAGKFHLAHGDLSQLATVAGLPLDGAVTADVELITKDGRPASRLDLRARRATLAGVALQGLELAAIVPFSEAHRFAAGTARATSMEFGGNRLANVGFDVSPDSNQLRIKASADVDDGAISAAARLAASSDAASLTIDKLEAARNGQSLALARPTEVRFSGEDISVSDTILRLGGGRLEFGGKLSGKDIAGDVMLVEMPAELVDMVAPQAGLRGRISASARLGGSLSNPVIGFDGNWSQAVTVALQQQGVPPIGVTASGSLRQGALETRIEARGRDGLALTSKVTLSGKALSQLDGRIDGRVPLQIANALLAARATRLSGEVQIAGQLGGCSSGRSSMAIYASRRLR